MSRLKWGILGTGNIARKYAAQLPQTARAELVAVGSRSSASAGTFADEFQCSPCNYEDLLADPNVEAVYISLPNGLHHEWTVRALRAGKHVLCEKPLAANANQAEEMFAEAEAVDRVLVEAFMYRCQPIIKRLLETVHQGAIGQLKLIRTHFTFNRPPLSSDVRYQSQLAGGSLMDIGCYCINLARAIAAAEPTEMHAVAHQHELGVDEYAAGTLSFAGEPLAVFTCGMTVTADRTTFIAGSEGYIAIETPWFSNGSFQIVKGDEVQTITEESPMDLYALEAEAFAAIVQDGAKPWITKDDSIGNMRVLDQLRKQT